ncbi:hypothetical protein VNO80_29916 [Phaseolus coccineus]|uniref:Uncharacterized protein n=1 Tax=Phaseolus coccineus TaxID=3886 RepID=A0AAN9QFB7_PHACN
MWGHRARENSEIKHSSAWERVKLVYAEYEPANKLQSLECPRIGFDFIGVRNAMELEQNFDQNWKYKTTRQLFEIQKKCQKAKGEGTVDMHIKAATEKL